MCDLTLKHLYNICYVQNDYYSCLIHMRCYCVKIVFKWFEQTLKSFGIRHSGKFMVEKVVDGLQTSETSLIGLLSTACQSRLKLGGGGVMHLLYYFIPLSPPSSFHSDRLSFPFPNLWLVELKQQTKLPQDFLKSIIKNVENKLLGFKPVTLR